MTAARMAAVQMMSARMTAARMAAAQMTPARMTAAQMAAAQMTPARMTAARMAAAQMTAAQMAPARMTAARMAAVQVAPARMAAAQVTAVQMAAAPMTAPQTGDQGITDQITKVQELSGGDTVMLQEFCWVLLLPAAQEEADPQAVLPAKQDLPMGKILLPMPVLRARELLRRLQNPRTALRRIQALDQQIRWREHPENLLRQLKL